MKCVSHLPSTAETHHVTNEPQVQAVRETSWQECHGVPRVVLMSGLNGEEQIGLSKYWEECARSDKPMFAAVIPETIGKPTLAVLKVRRLPWQPLGLLGTVRLAP